MTKDDFQKAVGAGAAGIHCVLMDQAVKSVVNSTATELACMRTFIELCAARVVAERTAPASDRCRIECEVRQMFDAVLREILPRYLDIVQKADVIADVELAAERRRRS